MSAESDEGDADGDDTPVDRDTDAEDFEFATAGGINEVRRVSVPDAPFPLA
jgi:hypothetical protein